MFDQGSDLDQLLARLTDLDGSDLFVTVGSPPMGEVHGTLVPLADERLTEPAIEAIATPLLKGEREIAFRERPDLDVAHLVPGKGRFRINLFRQRGQMALVARRIKLDVPTLDGMGLPHVLKGMATLKHGIVLVTGATGSGKSTTLAAMIDHRNATMSGHIVTIEDPIEFIHPHKRSVVSQREVGTDTLDWGDAMKSALRQAPSMILIGEIRDRQTAEAALHMSETGHLVLATLHSTNASQTLTRFAGLFPESLREQVYMLLAIELGGIVSQRLLPKKGGGGRVAALEILVATPRVKDLVSKGDVDTLKECMREAVGADGMQTFEDGLVEHVLKGRVRVEDALAHADSAADLKLRLRNEMEKRRGPEPPPDAKQKLHRPEEKFGFRML